MTWKLIYANDVNGNMVGGVDKTSNEGLIEQIVRGCPVRVTFDVSDPKNPRETHLVSVNCDPVFVRYGDVFAQCSMVFSSFVEPDHEALFFFKSHQILHINLSTTGKSHIRYQLSATEVEDAPTRHAVSWFVEL